MTLRRLVAVVTFVGLLGACARASCGSHAVEDRPGAGPRTPRSSTSPQAAERPASSTLVSKELQVLDKIKARRGGASVRYAVPVAAELEAFGAWFRTLISAGESPAHSVSDAPEGFELDVSDPGLWLAGERATARRGAGIFVIRAGPAARWVVEAPHTFFDVGTLEIAATCFDVMNARALLVNSVRRSSSSDEAADRDERAEIARSAEADSDLAHTPESFFATAHSALAQSTPGYAALQIHGFRDELLPGVGAVVSAAGTHAEASVVARELRGLLGADAVRLYPGETKKLGGTHNVQARLSQASGARFIHLELSRSLRARLTADPGFRGAFAVVLKTATLAMPER